MIFVDLVTILTQIFWNCRISDHAIPQSKCLRVRTNTYLVPAPDDKAAHCSRKWVKLSTAILSNMKDMNGCQVVIFYTKIEGVLMFFFQVIV